MRTKVPRSVAAGAPSLSNLWEDPLPAQISVDGIGLRAARISEDQGESEQSPGPFIHPFPRSHLGPETSPSVQVPHESTSFSLISLINSILSPSTFSILSPKICSNVVVLVKIPIFLCENCTSQLHLVNHLEISPT